MQNTLLKIAIIASGFKGYELARTLQWHPTKVSQIVIGAHHPTDNEKQQLADALGKSVSELFQKRTEVAS
jgi:hypothetical protein